jgi:hypothetical protein
MKTRIHSLFLLAVLLLGTVKLAQATRIPEVFAGTITQMSKKLMTIKGPVGSRQFDISKAGVCGWPTKKTCSEVFKVGDKVETSYFGDPASKKLVQALNIFYADEEKTHAFQEAEKNPP